MTTTTKRERARLALRQRILAGAMRVFARDGIAAFSIRRVAAEIDYSPGTLYRYFSDKDALLLAMQQDAFRCKVASLLPVMQIADPIERLLAMGHAYLKHGLEHPDEFRLMFVVLPPMQALDKQAADWQAGETGFQLLQSTVELGIAQGRFRPDQDARALAVLLWSTVHGLTTLHLSQRLSMLTETEKTTIQTNVLDQLDHFLRNCC